MKSTPLQPLRLPWLAGLFCAGGLLIAISWLLIDLPFTRDQGVFAFHGWRILEGDIPYRDMWDHKGPMIYYMYAFALSYFGTSMEAVNWFDTLYRLSALFALFFAARNIRGRNVDGLATAFVYALYSAFIHSSFWQFGQGETMMEGFLAYSLFAWTTGLRKRNPLWFAASGAFVGLAFAVKFTVGLWLFSGCLALFFLPSSERTFIGKGIAAQIVGFAITILPWPIYFASHGALGDLWDALFRFNAVHSVFHFDLAFLFDVFRQFFGYVLILLAPIIGSLFFVLLSPRENRPFRAMAGFLILSGIAIVIAQGWLWGFHFKTLTLALCFFAGPGVALLFSYMRKRLGAKKGLLALFISLSLAVTVSFTHFVDMNRFNLDYAFGKIEKMEFYRRINAADFSFLACLQTAKYAREATVPEDPVLVLSFEPLIYWLAGRTPPTRFIADFPLYTVVETGKGEELTVKFIREFLQDVKANPPKVIVIGKDDQNPMEISEDSFQQLEHIPPLKQYIQDNYIETEVYWHFHVFQKKATNQSL